MDELDTVKRRLSRSFLGRGGSHGVGLWLRDGAIYIHGREISDAVKAEIQAEAGSHPVFFIDEAAARCNDPEQDP